MQNLIRSIRLFVLILMVFGCSAARAQEDTTGIVVGQHQDDLSSVAVSGNGKLMASGSWDRSTHIYKITSDSSFGFFQSLIGHNAAVSAIGFSRDGKMLVTGGKDYKLMVWTSEENEEFELQQEMNMVHTAGINKVIVGPYKRMIYSAGDDGKIVVNNLAKGSRRVIDNGKSVNDIALSTNRQFIYCADESAILKQYDGVGNQIRVMEGHKDIINAVAASPDGSFIVTGSSDKTAIIWDAVTGKLKKTLGGHNWKVVSVDVSADSRYVITGCMDGSTKIWDVAKGEEVKSVNRIDGMVRQVTMSPDMKLVFIARQVDPTIETSRFGVVVWKSGLEYTGRTLPNDPKIRNQHQDRTRTAKQGLKGGATAGRAGGATTGGTPQRNTAKPKPVETKKEVITQDDEITITIEDE